MLNDAPGSPMSPPRGPMGGGAFIVAWRGTGEISGRGVLENVTDAHYYMDTTDVLDKHCPHTPIVHSNAVTCYEI